MDIFDRRGQRITDWRSWTRPKGDDQWRATRSAMELARAWFTSPVPVVPLEVAELLASHNLTRGAVLEEAWPELKTPLPYPGEGRNHDLVAIGNVDETRLLLAVEGKVDETMGPTIGSYWRKSKRTDGSRAWRRIDALLAAAFGSEAEALKDPWQGLPYQMLTALVGTAIEAANRSCGLGVLCVHEFVTESAAPEKLALNAADFRNFIVACGLPKPATGTLYGPVEVALPGTGAILPVLIGKVQYRWADQPGR